MFTRYFTPSFVLSSRSKGEADREFTLFSKKFGRIEAVGKSIRKIDSKLRGGILPFSVSRVEFIQGRYYKIITHTETVCDFSQFKNNLYKLRAAYKIRNVTEKLIKGQDGDDRIWQLIINTFKVLEKLDPHQAGLLYLFFSFKLLSLLGYRPELYTCLGCDKKLHPGNLYFCAQGGVVCEHCLSSFRKGETMGISVNCLKAVREMERRGVSFASKLKVGQDVVSHLEKVLSFYISYI